LTKKTQDKKAVDDIHVTVVEAMVGNRVGIRERKKSKIQNHRKDTEEKQQQVGKKPQSASAIEKKTGWYVNKNVATLIRICAIK
jgi:23S rRNA maturation-related 3'-5' exoribonuclease YhaM